MNHPKKLRIEWQQSTWVVRDPEESEEPGIPIDGAVVNATYLGADFVEGYMISVHGLDQEIASRLDRQALMALGVGVYDRTSTMPRGERSLGRVQLMPGGRIDHTIGGKR